MVLVSGCNTLLSHAVALSGRAIPRRPRRVNDRLGVQSVQDLSWHRTRSLKGGEAALDQLRRAEYQDARDRWRPAGFALGLDQHTINPQQIIVIGKDGIDGVLCRRQLTEGPDLPGVHCGPLRRQPVGESL
jgi:hypothetical protein